MKLVIVGGTGLVATELIRQSLAMPDFTSVVAVARRPVELEFDAVNSSKFKTVVIQDYEEYTDEVRKELFEADACIWTVAITPFRSFNFDFSEVKRVCQDCTIAGLKATCEANVASMRPVVFIYMSAEGTLTDLSKKPFILGDYRIMRGLTEKLVQEFGKEHREVDIHIVRPGMIWSSTTFWRSAQANTFRAINLLSRSIPNISLTELSAAILEQTVGGFEKEALSNADLVRIGGQALKRKARP